MSRMTIQTLRPNVSRDGALDAFGAGKVAALYWRFTFGPLRRIADAYVPFWLYRVRYQMGRALQTRLLALDAVDGSLDLYEFSSVPEGAQLLAVETRNRPPAQLTPMQADDLLREKVMRAVFEQGFFKLRSPHFDAVRENIELHVPYWLGFYGGNRGVRCRALDAVRRRIEGAKATAFFEQWLAA